jgi:hypothetical protein
MPDRFLHTAVAQDAYQMAFERLLRDLEYVRDTGNNRSQGVRYLETVCCNDAHLCQLRP